MEIIIYINYGVRMFQQRRQRTYTQISPESPCLAHNIHAAIVTHAANLGRESELESRILVSNLSHLLP